jgi:hypothetical protein
VTIHSFYFVGATFVLVSVLLTVAVYSIRRTSRASRSSWESLVKKLKWVDSNTITEIACDFLDEPISVGAGQVAPNFDISRIRGMIGGLEGLEILKHNSEVLIDLAAHLQHWYPDALTIAEELRMDARELEWHIDRLRGAAQTGNLDVSFPDYAQHAIATYYRMTRELLTFCEHNNQPMFVALQRAL